LEILFLALAGSSERPSRTVVTLRLAEDLVAAEIDARAGTPVFGDRTPTRIADIDATFGVALHMHQPRTRLMA
jgi:hypothetical protein